MSENLVQSVQDMLKEETWTRATISGYTQNDLKELTDIVEKAHAENCADEIQEICEEHLSHSKDSIIALYLAGIFNLQKNGIDNSNLETLVDIFQKNHKEAIVHYLCDTILADDQNNKFALRTLANSYLAENNDKYWELYAKIVRIDLDEADLAKTLAEHYEAIGDKETAIEYFKKTILRYIKIGNYNATKDAWTKLVQEIPEQIDFFNSLCRKISKAFGEYKTTTLMQELYTWYKDNQKWDVAIDILKQNLEVEPKDIWARKEITDCYRGKYASHSHLEEYIKSSNLTANYRNVFEAINDFEKHIAFDKGSYVFHSSWAVGRIIKLEKDTLTINFGRVNGKREMSLKMAVTALKPLPKNHIWVLKATKTREELTKYVKENREETLKIIIKSYDNKCDIKRIKAELVPSILSQSEWTSWNTSAKKILENDPTFAPVTDEVNTYTVRENEITPEEKLVTEFKAQKQFFNRVDIFMKYLNNDLTDKNNELFEEMYSYFANYLKAVNKVDEQVVASYLVVRAVTAAYANQFENPSNVTFAEIYGRLHDPDPKTVYTLLKDTKNTSLRKDFLECIKMLPDWNNEYISLFPTVLGSALLTDLISGGYTADVQQLVRTSYDDCKAYRDTVIYFFKNCQNEEWYKTAGISFEKQLITLIKILELTQKEIDNHVNSTDNKKIQKTIFDLLFNDEYLYNYIFADDGSKERVTKLYTPLDDLNETILDGTEDNILDYKAQLRSKILDKYPDFVFRTVASEEKSTKPKGMLVTNKKLIEKKAELERLQNVEIPENAKDISEAREKGDLKENQEYKSAKEKQHALNLQLKQLQNELNRATVFDPSTSTTAMISFGTVATLLDEDTKETVTYTILGPWESDPDNKVISYLSPLGNGILDMKVGETRTITVTDKKYRLTVKEIKKAEMN